MQAGREKISSSKKDEDALNTLNMAFEKLSTNLFQDTAWDVSSIFCAQRQCWRRRTYEMTFQQEESDE